MKRFILFLIVFISGIQSMLAQNGTRIEWDVNSRKFVTSGVYSRIVKLSSNTIALVYSDGPDVHFRKSTDNGATWSTPILVAHANGYNNTNAEMIRLKNGWLLYAWNGRPQVNGALPFTINIKISRDNGATWADQRTLYTADKVFDNGCWEPAMLQIPSGEIQLYFANENPYRNNADQEITMMRSQDNGLTWGVPKTVSYRAGARDGMPVPVYLNDNKGIAYAIEDNGLNGNFKPSIIWTSNADNWNQAYANGPSPRRWGALRSPLAASVYAGAPYLVQFPSGETLLSVQSEEGRTTPTMKVYVGDYDAKNFDYPSTPFSNVPNGGKALWNSLTVLDDNTVMASSSIDGISPGGIWTIVGRVRRNSQSPYGTTPIAIPGKIEVENFDNGGEAVAYHDLDASVVDANFRKNEGVDVQTCSEGGYNIGWTNPGEWSEYTVNVSAAGAYNLNVRIATANTGKSFQIELNGNTISGIIAVPNTGDWQTWQTVTIPRVSLPAGIQTLRVNMGTGGFNLNYVDITTPVSSAQWTTTQANQWYASQPWLMGCNFIPSTASNQLEMWQAATFDEATIDRELAYAESIGMNTVRVFLHYLVWQQDWPGYRTRIEKYLEIAQRHKIKTMFVLFDDCWNGAPKLGVQPAPVAGVHNSQWVQCPGDPQYKTSSLFPVFTQYTKDILSYFKNDSRILMWDLYNEAGNNNHGETTFPLLKAVFGAAWQVRPSQPITSGWWAEEGAMDDWILANSDVTTFHFYGDANNTLNFVNDNLRKYNRPIICTEYMARTIGSYFQTVTPRFYEQNIGAINWGLVDGKTQTKFPWGSPVGAPEPPLWFHEVFRKNGTPYEATETDMLRLYSSLPKNPSIHPVVPTKQAWSYTFSAPSSDWINTSFSTTGWATGTGGFGNETPIKWTGNDIWMRRTFTLPEFSESFLNSLFLNISHDEEAEVYFNGILAATLKGYSVDYIYFPINRTALQALNRGGSNLIAIHCHQSVGGQYIDAGIVSISETIPVLSTSEMNAQEWSYINTAPAANWTNLNFDAALWAIGMAGFGSAGTPGGIIRTNWTSSDIWLRKTFSLQTLPSNLILRMHHDEEIEVYLNGVLIKQETGFTTGYQNYSLNLSSSQLLTIGQNVLAIHCHQTEGGQFVDAGLLEPKAPASVKNNGMGLSGTYFNGINFNTAVFTRVDPEVNFNWKLNAPGNGVSTDSFSVRWTGFIQAPTTGAYTFFINSDNGRKLSINNQLVIDAFVNDWGIEYSGIINLVGGQRYPIALEYFEMLGGADIRMEWSAVGITRQLVPVYCLYPDFPIITSDQNLNPVVSITSPSANSTFSAPAVIAIQAIASDADGSITKVEFYNGSTLIGSDMLAPYAFTWNNVAAGTYAISVRATDNEGAVVSSAVVTITVTAPVNKLPIVSITSPANNSSFIAPGSIAIAATAIDADGSVSKVDFFNGNVLIGTDNSSPYSFTWNNVAAGTYVLHAKATDNAGAIASASVTILVTNPSTADIIGSDCISKGSASTYSLNSTKRTGALSYSWWYTGSVQSLIPMNGQPYQVIVSTGSNFTAGQLCIGVNYAVSPWYQQYCKNLNVCGTLRSLDSEEMEMHASVVAPNPSSDKFALTLPKNAISIQVMNVSGIESLRVTCHGSEIEFGNELKAGLYTLLIHYEDGTMEEIRISKL